MSKRWLINYFLIFLIILFSWIGTPNTEPKETVTISETTPQAITRISIETKDKKLEFNKPLDRWFITQPIQWPASDINLERLSTLVKLEPHSSLPNTEIDISSLGLRFPEAVITLNNEVIIFGDRNQIGSRRYLMVNDTVHLVTDNHLPFISTGLSGFINKSLIPHAFNIEQLQLPAFTLAKESNSWTTNKPFEGYSADQSNQLITHWQTLESTNIKPYKQNVTPQKKILAKTDQGELEFHLISIQPEIVIARPDLGVQYHFPDDRYYDLFSLKQQKMPLETASQVSNSVPQ